MRLPAEWERQSGIQLTWPDAETPWFELGKVQECYTALASAIQRFEPVMIVARDPVEARNTLAEKAAILNVPLDIEQIRFHSCPLNDTWARDHGGIAVEGDEGEKYIYDFVFNGWGLKFASDADNQITKRIFFDNAFAEDVMCVDMRPFVLEGGSIESDGLGTLLTTSSCLCSLNRNEYLEREEIESELKHAFGLKRVIWLENGGISGDDTDGHVDTLARFCSPGTIAYVQCTDPDDPDYPGLRAMEEELRGLKTEEGGRYELIPLPQPEPLYLDGYRLPASYANFLIVNGGVILPCTGCPQDALAKQQLSKVFPGREIVEVDCTPLLSGHGSIHCVTMQYPEGWIA